MRELLLLMMLSGRIFAAEPCPFLDKISKPGLENAMWGLSVRDAATGKEIAACDNTRNLIPASIMKLFVTAAALDSFGPGARFKTRVYLNGTVGDGVLNGSVYIRGGGDPSFGSKLIKGAPVLEQEFGKWEQALREAGVAVIKGSITADETLFEGQPLPGSWAWEDIGNYYAAQPSALSVNDNLYKLYFKPGRKEGDAASVLRTEPELPGLSFDNFMLTGPADSGDNAYIFSFPGQYSAVLRGTVPKGPAEFPVKGAIPDPALFAARAFAEYLAARGIPSGGISKLEKPMDYGAARFLAETEGARLKDIVFTTNKRSFNLYAEILLRHLALAAGKAGTEENGLAALRAYMAESGMDVSELKMDDAAGLSRRNLVQAEDFSLFLAAMSKKPFFGAYADSLVLPGDPDATGHVKKLGAGTALEKSLRIKSGSLNGVRAYAGYLSTKKGKLLVFTSLLNNYTSAPAEIDKLHEAVLLELHDKY